MIEFINAAADIVLLALLLASAVMILRSASPLSVVVISTIYSLTICMLFVVMDAVDVAFTEAAVGAGISGVLMLSVIKRVDEPVSRNAANENAWPSPLALLCAAGLGIMLIAGTLDMPLYGDPGAPVHQHLVSRYLFESKIEIGIPNTVTSVLASYRGYDTLGEVVVIFTAGTAVLILLAGVTQASPVSPRPGFMAAPVIRRVLLRIVPLVLLFALYVQFHGDYGPGGGFQAGVIFAAGVITWGLLSRTGTMQSIISERWTLFAMGAGVLLYGLTGIAGMFAGGQFLNYSVLAKSPTAGQHAGILMIEFGVGVTVAFTMISLFMSFNREEP